MRLITMGLMLLASSNVVATEALSEQDLMNNYVEKLESKFIGKQIDLYDSAAVFDAVKKHHQYLMLCSHKFAERKCNQAKIDLKVLDATLTAHFKFQKDLSDMWEIKESLAVSSPNEHGEVWREFKSNYDRSLTCGLVSGEVDQDCMSKQGE